MKNANRLIITAVTALLLGHGWGNAEEPLNGLGTLELLSRTFRQVYEEVAPAVVLIRTSPDMGATFGRQRRLPPDHPRLPNPYEERSAGLGSGTLVSSDGYILSNYHVVEGSDSITVVLADRRSFQAEVVGFDSLIDIALLKIDAGRLPVARLGESTDLQVGDWVLAIGHPLGLGSTLTHGIVSALGRSADVIEAQYGIESFIQTNAVINPGNSGGPLLNLAGEVVGINTAISTRTGWYMGYALAIPIDLIEEAMADILEYGRVVRGYLGIEMEQVDQRLVDEMLLDMPAPRGILVDQILAGTPAERSELAAGDIIMEVDDLPVDRPNQVQTGIYGRDPGDVVNLSVLRDGTSLEIRIVLGEQEEDRLLAEGHRRLDALGLTVELLGLKMAEQLGFTAQVAAELGYGAGQHVVVVVGVDPAGPAAIKGIQVSDVITEIDDEPIKSVDAFFRSISHLETDKSALFWFWRPDRGIDVRALKIAGQG